MENGKRGAIDAQPARKQLFYLNGHVTVPWGYLLLMNKFGREASPERLDVSRGILGDDYWQMTTIEQEWETVSRIPSRPWEWEINLLRTKHGTRMGKQSGQ